MPPTMIFALVVFTFVSVLGLFMGVLWTINREIAFKMLSQPAGVDLLQTSTISEKIRYVMNFLLVDFTSQMIGFNLLAFLMVWVPFRHGELWAWGALWYYPLMFLWHYFHYAKGTRFSKMQILYFILTAIALLITYPQFTS